MNLRALTCDLLLLAACAAAIPACFAEVDDTGTVGVALTASDATGATYRLTPGARLVMMGGTYYEEFSLDGDSAFVRIDVPPGDYSAEAMHDTIEGLLWPLERRLPTGETEIVYATLTTPMPAAVTIANDALTNLVLRFSVPDIGPITFDEGSVDVAIEVTGSSPSGLDLASDAALDVATVTIGPTAPEALAPRLPALGDVDLVHHARAAFDGAWYRTSATTACTETVVNELAASHPGVADILTEAGANLDVCITLGAAGQPQAYLTTIGVSTAPFTGTFSDLGVGSYMFVTRVIVDLPASVWDGEVLDLAPLVGPHELTATAMTRVSFRGPGETARRTWHQATYTGTISLGLQPRP